MILAIIVGFMSGWLISMPIGPTNAAAISRTINLNYKHGFVVGLGGALMDVIYCGGATQINVFLLNSPIFNLSFKILGFGLLLYLGITSLLSKKETQPFAPSAADTKRELKGEERLSRLPLKKASYVGSFFLGVLLYASNIAGVPEWIFISSFWNNQGISLTGYSSALGFAIGAGIGTAGWFFTVVRYFAKRSTSLKPLTLRRINHFTGGAMLAFGLYFGYQIIWKTNWKEVDTRWNVQYQKTMDSITNSK
ncbi:MAG: LysE family transporter [bacterium]